MDENGQRLQGDEAATRLEEISDQLRARAGVLKAQHGAHKFLFDLLLAALCENLRRNGNPSFSLTYDQWTLLANGRDSGKRTSRANVLRFFNEWKRLFGENAVSSGLRFEIFTPERRGPSDQPGLAGARVVDVDVQAVVSPSELTIHSLLTQRREEEAIRQRLETIHDQYLDAAREAGGNETLLARLRRRLAGLDADVARKIARTAAAVLMVVLVGGFGAQRAIAKYRRDLTELRRKAVQWMGLSTDARCVDGHSVVDLRLSFNGEDTAPPFILLRNDIEIARFTERAQNDEYAYTDTTVQGGLTYTYRVAREMYLTHERAYSRPWDVAVPRCRGTNRLPTVSNIRISPNPAHIGEPIRVSIVSTDAENDPLEYVWTFGHQFTRSGDAVQTRSFDRPGFVHVGVTVQDGHEGYVYREARIGVTDSKPHNSPPYVRALLVVPEIAAPGEWVRLIAVAGDTDGDPLQFEWNPGGPQSGSGGDRYSVQYIYRETGTMLPRVTVSDSSLAETTASAEVEITGDAPPPEGKCSSIGVSPAWSDGSWGKGPVGTTFHFTPQFTDGTPTDILWTFGDGSPIEHTGPSRTVEHKYRRAGIYWTFAVAKFRNRTAACPVMVSVGEVPYTPEPEIGLRGTITPDRGTPATIYQFRADAGRPVPGRQYRWTFTDRYSSIQIQSAWGPEPVYARLLPEGLWAVECEVREPTGSRAVLKIGDVFVRLAK